MTELAYFKDGGSTGIKGIDGRGQEFSLCFGGSMVSRTSSRIYFGAFAPKGKGSRMLPEGSDDEKAVVTLLQGWVDSHFTRERQQELHDRHSVTGLPQREYWTLRILRAFSSQHSVRRTREWLDANYSPQEQTQLLRRPDEDGLSEKDQEAWHKIQSLHAYPVRRRNRSAR